MEPSPLLGFEVVKDPGLLNFFAAITSTVRASNHSVPPQRVSRTGSLTALLCYQWKCLCIKLDESIYATSLPAPPTIPLSPITHATSSGSPPSPQISRLLQRVVTHGSLRLPRPSIDPNVCPSAQSPFEAAILPLLEKRLPRYRVPSPSSTRFVLPSFHSQRDWKLRSLPHAMA